MRGAGRTAGVAIDQVYSVHRTDKPVPLVPRGRTAQIAERVTVDGEVLAPMDDDAAREAVRALLAREDRRGDRHRAHVVVSQPRPRAPSARDRRGGGARHVTCRSRTRPRRARASTSARSRPSSTPTSGRPPAPTSSSSPRRSASAVWRARRSSCRRTAAWCPVDVARARPLTTIGSGPAGGLAGTAFIAAASGHRHVIATDMGGTSFEVGLVIDGAPLLSGERGPRAVHVPDAPPRPALDRVRRRLDRARSTRTRAACVSAPSRPAPTRVRPATARAASRPSPTPTSCSG